MNKVLFICMVILLGCSKNDTSQKDKISIDSNKLSEDEDLALKQRMEEDFGEMQCVYTNNVLKKSDIFPFNKATKIAVFSFETWFKKDGKDIKNSSSIVNNVFSLKQQNEKIVLNEAQADSLFSILHYYKPKRLGNTFGVADCYNPRHSIVFYQGESAIAFIEICLECSRIKTSETYNLNGDSFCNGQWCFLYHFFKFIGIKRGFEITDGMCNRE